MDVQTIALVLTTSGLTGGTVFGLIRIIFENQNRRIAKVEASYKDLDAAKTDRELCKTIHANVEKNSQEIKEKLTNLESTTTECYKKILQLGG